MVKSKKILAFLLTAAMTLSLLPTFTLTASAEETATTEKNITLGTSAIKGQQVSNVYFGNFQQTSAGATQPTGTQNVDWIKKSKAINDCGPYYNIDPIKWRVLDNDNDYDKNAVEGETDTTRSLFLLSDKNLDMMPYYSSQTNMTWAQSAIRSWLNGDEFYGFAFSNNEKSGIAKTNVVNDDNATYNIDGGENTEDYIFLLSSADVKNDSGYGFTASKFRYCYNTEYNIGGGKYEKQRYGATGKDEWWLRSPGMYKYFAAYVNGSGDLSSSGKTVNDNTTGVRPALNLNSSNVLFTSAADGGKSIAVGTLFANAENTGNEYKLTMLDSTRSFALTDTSEKIVKPNGSLSIDYTGANTGDNEYISAMLLNEDDEVLYYGQLAESTQADGTVSVDLPSDLIYGKSYTLKLFNEQINGDKKTDFSSNFVNVTLKVELDGKGTETSPYLISDLADLEYFRNCVNNGNDYSGKYVKLSEDIDMSEKYNETTGESWTPIGIAVKDSTVTTGGSAKYPFKGKFDGNGKTISELYIYTKYSLDVWDGMYKGLFGVIQDAEVKNLTVSGKISSDVINSSGTRENIGSYVGGITAYAKDSVIENCVSNCTISGKTSVGGLVGIVYSSEIKECSNLGVVNFKNSGGGIAGYVAPGTTIENCLNSGAISGVNNIGGIIGFGRAETESKVIINNCCNTGTVSGTGDAGGIVGADTDVEVTNSYYPENCVESGTTLSNTKGTSKTAEQFASGEVAWLLNGSTSTGTLVWGQTLTGKNKDAYPVFGGKTVYQQASGNTYANSLITTAKITADAPSFNADTTMYDKDGNEVEFAYDENANVTTVYVKIDGAEAGVKPIIKITGGNGTVESQTWTAVNNIYYAQFIGDFADFGTIEVTYKGAESVTISTTTSTEEDA